ncbi:Ada metal-binding domain-containing protein [Ekhidna sp.]|uniref:Ada metal-binding domain-containing protein n=1 Tax=Ekhidna sp. TaxID=2608089 RepID=UPI003B59E0D2
MMPQADMIAHLSISDRMLYQAIKSGKILWGGNKRLKIYGTLNCRSGKRIHKQNRVFFVNEDEAITAGYRPCGHCMREKYKLWKNKI